MKKLFAVSFRSLSLLALVLSTSAIDAQVTGDTSVTTPVGVMTITFPAVTTVSDVLTYFTLPLSNTPLRTSTPSAVGPDSLTFANVSWTPGQYATNPASFFIRIMSGAQEGRILKITGNTQNTLTVSTVDDTSTSTPLNTANFSVTTSDIVELHQADTLASLFGDNISVNGTIANPLAVIGASRAGSADTITILDKSSSVSTAYWFNTSGAANQWRSLTGTGSRNETPIFPDSAILLLRRKQQTARAAQPFTFTGVVSTARTLQKSVPTRGVPTSLNFPTDVTLASLQIGGGWTKANRAGSADTLSVFNPSNGKFDAYYQRTDNSWRLLTGAADVSSTVIPAGSVVLLLERTAGSGPSGYFSIPLPYSLN